MRCAVAAAAAGSSCLRCAVAAAAAGIRRSRASYASISGCPLVCICKKQHGGEPLPVGKRVFCSNRRSHDGCGRTIRLFLDNVVRSLHATADQVSAFVLALVAGVAVAHAYLLATGGPARNAWRWLNKMQAQLPNWRSLAHQPPLPVTAAVPAPPRYLHQTVLRTTLTALCGEHDGQSLCRALQRRQQQAFM
ncbi:MAG: hypothetical protein Q8R69_27440 [Telluria sp.]|nr:hypothetical protein [Telluria sp.]